MENCIYHGNVLWSMVDANQHMRHSAYADFAAHARVEALEKMGLPLGVFRQLMIGPILLREELIYLREVHLNDTVTVHCALEKISADHSKWSFRQEIFRSDGIKAAIIHVDGAWLDLKTRKLTALPEEYNLKFEHLPKTDDFKIIDK